jgi:putative peptidoglycan lipid II flippase
MAMLTVAAATGVVKLAAIVKEMVIAAQFGAGDQIDAFVIAFLLPSFVIGVVSSAFQAAVIPTYVQVRDHDGPGAARELLSDVTLWSCVLLLTLTGVLVVAAPAIIPLIASKFGPEKLWLTQALFFFLLPLVVLTGFTAIWGAALNAEERFIFVSVTPLATPILIVLTLFAVGGVVGIYALPAGMVLGGLIEAGVLARRIRRQGLWVIPRWRRVHPETGAVMKQFIPMAVGAFLMSSTGVVDLSMAAMLGPGSVATLNYANRLVMFLLGFCSAAMSTVLLPHFSGMVARHDWVAVRDTVRMYLRWIALTTVPFTAVLIWLSVPITRLMFERGAFGAEATLVVGGTQALFLIQMPFYLMSIVLVRLISSLKANHLLMWGSAISVVVNIALNYAFMQWLGVRGIALSTTVVYVVSFCFLSIVLSRLLKNATAGGA